MRSLSQRSGGRAAALLAMALAGGLGQTSTAAAEADTKKAVWGPPDAFSTYADLGVGIYQSSVFWPSVASTRPANPTDPSDPAYSWPTGLDAAISAARETGIQVAVNLEFAPRWANGNRAPRWAPKRAADFANFAAAASRRYPYVRYWLIWAEPSRRASFRPMARVTSGRPLSGRENRGPRVYARILDSSFGALKNVESDDLVVGGLTIPGGDIRPQRFIQAMRLPNGKPPRMDLYGHNAYSPRLPRLAREPASRATADLSDLDTLCSWLDRYLGRAGRNRKLKVFVSEYSLPSDHASAALPFWGNRNDQARYLRAALRIARSFNRLYTLGWFRLDDEPPQPNGLETNWGLLDWRGNPKPSFYAYKNG